jgi:hypothetical protein
VTEQYLDKHDVALVVVVADTARLESLQPLLDLANLRWDDHQHKSALKMCSILASNGPTLVV